MRFVLVVLMFVATEVRAGELRTEHYGDKVAVADAVSASLFAGGFMLATQVDHDVRYLGLIPIFIGAGGYGAFAPLTHIGYEKDWAARGSFAMRIVLPVVGLWGGTRLVSCASDERTCSRRVWAGALGAGAGAAIATTIDAVLLAKTDLPIVYVVPNANGASAGLAVSF